MLNQLPTVASLTLFICLAFSSPLAWTQAINDPQNVTLPDPKFLRILGYKGTECGNQQNALLIDDPAAQESRVGECMDLNTPGKAWRAQLYNGGGDFNRTLYMYHKACGEALVHGDVFETYTLAGDDDNNACYRGKSTDAPDFQSVCFGAACPQVSGVGAATSSPGVSLTDLSW